MESSVKEVTYRNRKLVHIEEKRRMAAAALPVLISDYQASAEEEKLFAEHELEFIHV